MDASNIDVSVVQGFAWASPHLCEMHNEYLLEGPTRFPGRILAFATWCPGAALPGAGFRGVGELRPDEQGVSDWGELEALRTAVHTRPLLVHASEPVGHVYRGKGGMTPSRLYGLLQRY